MKLILKQLWLNEQMHLINFKTTNMNFQFKYLFIFLVLIVACKNKSSTTKSLEVDEVIPVTTHLLSNTYGSKELQVTGVLTVEQEAKYSFKVGGVVDKIFIDNGEYFKKGKLLAILKRNEIEAGLLQSKLALEKAERDLKRVANLFRDSVATLEQYQNATTAYNITKQQYESIAFNKEYSSIYAQRDGFVIKKLAQQGEIVASGSPILVIGEQGSNEWVLRVGLSDKDWALVEVGASAKVYLDAFPNQHIQGRISKKLLTPDIASGTFQAEIKLVINKVQPAIGMFGKASISISQTYTFQSIPYSSLVEADGNKAFVFIPIDRGRVKKQAIEIFSFNDDYVQVKAGLEGVKEIVKSNSAFLNESSLITIIRN